MRSAREISTISTERGAHLAPGAYDEISTRAPIYRARAHLDLLPCSSREGGVK
jgi:hypothetical protein